VEALEAIRRRRSVRRYTDRPVDDATVDRLLRLAVLAPTGGGAQAWSLLVVREPERRRALAELIERGGAEYFRIVRPTEGRTPEEQAEWARGFARQALGTYVHVPVWIAGLLVPRGVFPAEQANLERDADLMSVAFMMENLFVAARALGLGTVPTVFQWFDEAPVRELLELPDEVEVPLITPLGYPEEFPAGLPPAVAKLRRPWRTLVHDETWGRTRA
jgi:nitroreductase